MSSQLTHERCSELLADYLARELELEQHRLVEDHLEHCAQCSAERAGLEALGSGESEGLTRDERVALRAAVLGATTAEPVRHTSGLRSGRARPALNDESDAVVVPLGGRGSRASRYLGIAAMLAILAVGSLFVLRGGGLGVTGSDDNGDAGSAAGTAEDSGSEDVTTNEAPEAAPRSQNWRLIYQSDRGAISRERLDELGRRSILLRSKSAAQASDSAQGQFNSNEGLRDLAPEERLERLAARAPDSLAPDVTECGRTALDELDEPGLATYATTATLEGDEVVVIGLVTGARTPDRYAVFAFPLGDCTTILTSTEGPLD